LAAPFPATEIRFKPAVVNGNRALAIAYIDARAIQDRLDEVLGVEGWEDSYKGLPDGSVVCRLRLWLGDRWIAKVDVGGPSEQPDSGDRRKAAFSDALKRAAVKFGVGRYLHRVPSQWVDYDPKRRQFVRPPSISVPGQAKAAAAPAPPDAPTQAAAGHPRPASGTELQQRLRDYDAKLARLGLSAPGALIQHVVQAGTRAGYTSDLATWSGAAMELAVETTKAFENQARRQQGKRKDVA
jgi:hypothetical protein